MYKFVSIAETKRYRDDCSETLTDLRDLLWEEYDIKSEFVLVGSGARNLVTQNGEGPFDLDYNLIISRMPDVFCNDLRKLKNTVISSLNKIAQNNWFSDGHDSTSVVASYLYFKDTPNVKFSFDIAILWKNKNGTLCRLIHNKQNGTFTWCEVPSSKKVKSKVEKIKSCGQWNEVRDRYLKLKNLYLSREDPNHPSYIVYVEAVQQVYQKIQSKKSQTQNQSKQQNKNKKQPQKKQEKNNLIIKHKYSLL